MPIVPLPGIEGRLLRDDNELIFPQDFYTLFVNLPVDAEDGRVEFEGVRFAELSFEVVGFL